MSESAILAIALGSVLAAFALKIVLGRLLRFKMDESTILTALRSAEEGGVEIKEVSTRHLSAVSALPEARVKAICQRSRSIKVANQAPDAWSLMR